MNILQKNSFEELSKMFGLKKESDINYHNRDIVHELTMKAIERYTGVAFDYLDYRNLSATAQAYIDNNVILCSNLCNYSAPSTTKKGNFPRNNSSNAKEEETSCLRQVDK